MRLWVKSIALSVALVSSGYSFASSEATHVEPPGDVLHTADDASWSMPALTNYASHFSAAQRFLRCVTTAASIVADYKWVMARSPVIPEPGPVHPALESDDRLSEVHRRSALKLLRLCERNGGIYVKLGQHLAQLDYVLPDEYCDTLRPLLNACPVQPIESVEATLFEDLGISSLSDLFLEFDPVPVASASLAQVHRARLRTDARWPKAPVVAVKVQHRGLSEASLGDIATVQFLVSAAQHLFAGSFDYQWLVDEIRDNLPRELDFEEERRNGERCRQQLRMRDPRRRTKDASSFRADICVPHFFEMLSSSRILTMSFEDGVPVSDVTSIVAMGLAPRDVAEIVDDVFTDQIFVHGFVHSDPHPGNLLVRRRKDDPSKPLLVLLDHGLYRELDSSFRLQYATLWHGIVRGDADEIRKSALGMGVDEKDVELFTSMLTTRSWNDVVSVHTAGTKHVNRLSSDGGFASAVDRKRVQSFARERAPDIGRVLSRVPRPLLLLLKTNDCLRGVDRRLGAPTSMIEMIARKVTTIVVFESPMNMPVGSVHHVDAWSGGHLVRIMAWWHWLCIELRLLAFRVLAWWHQFRNAVERRMRRR